MITNGPTTSAAVTAALGHSTKKDLLDLSAHGMYEIWAKTAPEFNEKVKFVQPFTAKQNGQMKLLVKGWGDDAGIVLEYILMSWGNFLTYIKVNSTDKVGYCIPNTGLLVKHMTLAKNMYLNNKKPPKVWVPVPSDLVPPKPKDGGDKPMTTVELKAFKKLFQVYQKIW